MRKLRRALEALLEGRHALAGGLTRVARAQNLPVIAASYSMSELLEEEGIGPVRAKEIALWLESKGLSLKPCRHTGTKPS